MNHLLCRSWYFRAVPRSSPIELALLVTAGVVLLCVSGRPLRGDDPETRQIQAGADRFQQEIKPVLEKYCFDCHGEGKKSGQVALDAFSSDPAMLKDAPLWLRVLKNVRAGIMPPANKDRPNAEEIGKLENWIKYDAFGIDPKDPDPGRSTIRRLNRTEYRNTIRDLLDFDYDTSKEFPPDDPSYGFDNIGELLTVSPLLLEKYMQAAKAIVTATVPTISGLTPEKRIMTAKSFTSPLSFTKDAKIVDKFKVDIEGDYRVVVDMEGRGAFEFNPSRAETTYKIDDQERTKVEYSWREFGKYHYEYNEKFSPGEHTLSIELKPLPASKAVGQLGRVPDVRVKSVVVEGPMGKAYLARPKNYEKFFPLAEPPSGEPERTQYARAVLRKFATRAFRRPVDEPGLDRLVKVMEVVAKQPEKTFEQTVSQALVAILSSPRFIYRMEEPATQPAQQKFGLLDEYSLATRLSYFLWSTMPDEKLFQLAQQGQLRKNLPEQVKRMLQDPRAEALTRNFVGQWLQTRAVDKVAIDPASVLKREGIKSKFSLDANLRAAMRLETESLFSFILKEDRSLLELIDSNYTFLNERLAKHYGIPNVVGAEMRKVELPADSPRGSILTHASVLMVTSNSTRTSPVKRGVFVLDNILGSPVPPPPANVPALEDSADHFKDREPSVRELLTFHRSNPLCSSCHKRTDPIGLSLESFNAMGMAREKELDQAIETTGKLVSGETFNDVKELRRIITHERRLDFYRCFVEKLFTFALGRAADYYDVEAIDAIVAQLEREQGRLSVALTGIINSAPFQKMRISHEKTDNP
jgi:hypothetical protein